MTDIEIFIQNLNSPDLEQRYFACKNLRKQDQLPPEAVNALHKAAADSDPLVSTTAEMALLQYEPRQIDPILTDDSYIEFQAPYTSREIITCLVLSVVIALLTIPLISIITDDRLNDLWFISVPTLLIAGYISHLSYEDGRQRPVLAVLTSLAVCLLSGIIIYLLLSGLFLMAVSAYFGNI
jgi:hypothetical protein